MMAPPMASMTAIQETPANRLTPTNSAPVRRKLVPL